MEWRTPVFVRTFAAGAALVGALTLGPAAVAGAQTPQQPTPATTTTKCQKAEALLAKVQQREQKVQARITALEARVAKLRTAGKNARADALQARIDTVKARLSKAEARATKLEARIDAKCNVAPSTGSGSQAA
jgi:peptidoglycan hydrolase CwlO-like protein